MPTAEETYLFPSPVSQVIPEACPSRAWSPSLSSVGGSVMTKHTVLTKHTSSEQTAWPFFSPPVRSWLAHASPNHPGASESSQLSHLVSCSCVPEWKELPKNPERRDNSDAPSPTRHWLLLQCLAYSCWLLPEFQVPASICTGLFLPSSPARLLFHIKSCHLCNSTKNN